MRFSTSERILYSYTQLIFHGKSPSTGIILPWTQIFTAQKYRAGSLTQIHRRLNRVDHIYQTFFHEDSPELFSAIPFKMLILIGVFAQQNGPQNMFLTVINF